MSAAGRLQYGLLMGGLTRNSSKCSSIIPSCPISADKALSFLTMSMSQCPDSFIPPTVDKVDIEKNTPKNQTDGSKTTRRNEAKSNSKENTKLKNNFNVLSSLIVEN